MDHIPSIELAIKNERSEMEYYLGESKRSRNPVAKALFKTLAEDEKEHMNKLRILHEKLTKDGSWPDKIPLEVNGTNIDEVLESIARDKSSAEDHDMDDIEALKKGIEFEAKGSRFYGDLAADCDNSQEKEFFTVLSRIERQHMLSIQESLSYLEDSESWFAKNERSGLDGA